MSAGPLIVLERPGRVGVDWSQKEALSRRQDRSVVDQ